MFLFPFLLKAVLWFFFCCDGVFCSSDVDWDSLNWQTSAEHICKGHFLCLPEIGKFYTGSNVQLLGTEKFLEQIERDETPFVQATSGLVKNKRILAFRDEMLSHSFDYNPVIFKKDGSVFLQTQIPKRKKLEKYQELISTYWNDIKKNIPVWQEELHCYNITLANPLPIRTFILKGGLRKPTVCLHYEEILENLFNRTEKICIVLSDSKTVRTLYPILRYVFWSESKLSAVIEYCKIANDSLNKIPFNVFKNTINETIGLFKNHPLLQENEDTTILDPALAENLLEELVVEKP